MSDRSEPRAAPAAGGEPAPPDVDERVTSVGRRPLLKMVLAYGAMIAATVVLFRVICIVGRGLTAPAALRPAAVPQSSVASGDVLYHVLLALVLILVATRAVGALFRRLGQPPVVGEVLAGILLGPSLLGHIAPAVAAYLLPASLAPFLSVLAQVGVVLYMFLVGIELDTTLLRRRTEASVAISHASIIAPFLLGATLALLLYPRFSSADVPFTVFALFLGVSMSVTAFPVLARILTDRRMQRSRLGAIALACAAVDDVTAWCLLALLVGFVHAEPGRALITVVLTAGYIAGVLLLLRPAVVWFVGAGRAPRRLTPERMTILFVALLLSALATELIGIHALFGAFLIGAIIPHDSPLARDVAERFEGVVVVLLLPVYFAFTGTRTQIALVSGIEQWAMCILIILVASFGKFGGSAVAARLTGLEWSEASAIGVLMNTRGLMELIVLNIGLDLGVLSPTLFAMLVLMALVTTIATTPVLHLLSRRRGEIARAAVPEKLSADSS